MIKKTLLATCLALALPVLAAEITIQGVGVTPLAPGADPAMIRSESLAQAKRDAVVAAINKINGPNAARDPKVQSQLDLLAKQIPDNAVFDQTSRMVPGNGFETKVTLKLDDAWFRTLVNDAGLNLNTAGYKIMVLIDEYHTTPVDRQKPVREIVEYSHDKTATSASSNSSAQSSAEFAAGSQSSAYAGRSDSAVYVETARGNAAGARTVQAAGKSSASYQAGQESSSSSSGSQFDQKNDVVNFKKLVEYLPRNVGPEKSSATYAALMREAGQYNLELMDADRFKSKVSLKPFTIEDLNNSGAADQLIARARKEFKADYLMTGTVYVLDIGKRGADSLCDGVVSLKAFSTEDSRLLVADSHTESSFGNSPEQCANSVGNKLAKFVGSTVGSRARDYAKNQRMNGKEYNIQLVSLLGELSSKQRRSFSKALSSVKGLTSEVDTRESDTKSAEFTVKYAAGKSFEDALMETLESVPGFENAESSATGTTLKVCVEGRCPN